MAADTVLAIEGLALDARIRRTAAQPVADAHVEVRAGEIVGLVGESGSGKTLTALSALRLLPDNIEIAAGRIEVGGQDVRALDEDDSGDGGPTCRQREHDIAAKRLAGNDRRLPDRVVSAQLRDDRRDIGGELVDRVSVSGLLGLSVATHVERSYGAALLFQYCDDAIPHAGVRSEPVDQQHAWTFAARDGAAQFDSVSRTAGAGDAHRLAAYLRSARGLASAE